MLEIGEAVEATITAEVTTITITVEVTAETKVKVDSIGEVVVVANTAVDTKTTAKAVKQVMAVVEVVAVTAGAGTIIRMMVVTTVSMEDSRVMVTTSGAVEAAEAMINNAGNEPVVKEAKETGGIKRIETSLIVEKKIMPLFNPVSTQTRTNHWLPMTPP